MVDQRLRRGDIVIAAFQGEYGKVRPGIVVQSELLNDIPSIIIVPCTSDLVDECIYRPDIPANAETGLDVASQGMADKLVAISLRRVRTRLGSVDLQTLEKVKLAVRFVTGELD